MASLFDQVSFAHGASMANRFMLAPLTNLQSHADGTLSDHEFRWLSMRGEGGFGLTMTCAAHVQANGQAFAGQLGVFGDQHLAGLTRLADALNASGTLSFMQLHHGGDKAQPNVSGLPTVSASDRSDTGTRGLSQGEVAEVVADFVAAARRAQQAGFHGVELHGAHGYLICQFLSAESNHRTDQYGGSADNRSRLLFEIIDGVRVACGSQFALAVRLSPERLGLDTAEVIELYGQLVESGNVDLIDMSLWDVNKEPEDERFKGQSLTQLFASLPRGDVRLAVAGRIHTPADAQRVVDAGVDIPVLGRVGILHHDYPKLLVADPAWSPRTLPVEEGVLASEGVSPAFVEYLRTGFRGFIAVPAEAG
jgi:2,4-dienoyl-CoA reductase-like NADH-dependent reductase (Old Yellow Enzyme family)